MRHLIMSNHQCLLYSAAMALDVDVEDITDILGHDGLAVINPDAKGSARLQGIHIQEIQSYAFRLGRHFYPIEVVPVSIGRDPLFTICGIDYATRFLEMTRGQRGILIGESNGAHHAVAFLDDTIYDPCGKKYSIGSFKTREAWILC